MAHHHHPEAGGVLKWSLIATALFVIVEVIAGFRAHSLALISDAGHNFTDALALLLAAFGLYLQSKPADSVKTYGYHRAGVLAAFVNALTLVVLSLVIFYESYVRLTHPVPVAFDTMLWVAVLGLLLNGSIMLGLRQGSEHDLNVRAAFVHMMGDALGSIGIIVGAVIIRYTGWEQVDPVLSIVIGALIVWTARDIIKESLNILLEGLPRGLRLADVTGGMRTIPGVIDVHDLHIWSLGSEAHALSCHVLIEDMPPSESTAILNEINLILCDRFHIHHTTIQFEHTRCALAETPCTVAESQHRHPHVHTS
ncbi:MAG TPA: cation diffusion facilitator family transporter [Bryobacteraceae bacterium]|nr:cation diffusion facilitator family transporter [Bryobacteraceae bacterium]